jgi:hypothetical protein
MKLKLLAAAAIMAAAVPANATCLVNGSFEDGLAGWTRTNINGGTGFTVTNGVFSGLPHRLLSSDPVSSISRLSHRL